MAAIRGEGERSHRCPTSKRDDTAVLAEESASLSNTKERLLPSAKKGVHVVSAVRAEEHSPTGQKLGIGESGWSQKSSVVTGKPVRCFPSGTKHLASDCPRERSFGSPQVAFVRHTGFSQKNPNASLGHTSME